MPDQAWASIATPMLALHVALHWLVVAAYCWLFITLIRSGMHWRVLFFTTWVGVMAVYLAIWDPYNIPLLIASQPILLSLRICVLIEAFVLVTPRITPEERRWILVFMLAVAAAGIRLSFGFYSGDRPLDWYLAIKQHSRIGMALAALFGALEIARKPPRLMEPGLRNHGLILVFFLVVSAANGFVTGPSMGNLMMLNRCAFWAVTLLCICLWRHVGIPRTFKLPNPGLQILQVVLNVFVSFAGVFKHRESAAHLRNSHLK